ncbi:MarR family transcriptional regulator [Maribrevibacterium harenarium]|uniref:MarR family transcriptional regulator n=1 Tax=Maribrevibacterium harenarium TaxID=2589817 RepID=A0A501WYL7_9GAMM|nr:MarR family transcriptional regulator [Maribrevibacterium harenarium]TPE53354.1 MarR family transcriptional regulator [Maribrevibacterium harenarium]
MTLFAMPGHLIRRLQQRSNQVFQEKMKQLELDITSVQFAAMHALYDEKQMEQAQIAAHIAYDKATIGGVIDRLEKKGWISRTPSLKDKRAKIVTLTKSGEAIFLQLLPEVQNLQSDILNGLDQQQTTLFIELASIAVSQKK